MNPRPLSLSQNPSSPAFWLRLQLDDDLMRAGRVRANESNARSSHTRREQGTEKNSIAHPDQLG